MVSGQSKRKLAPRSHNCTRPHSQKIGAYICNAGAPALASFRWNAIFARSKSDPTVLQQFQTCTRFMRFLVMFHILISLIWTFSIPATMFFTMSAVWSLQRIPATRTRSPSSHPASLVRLETARASKQSWISLNALWCFMCTICCSMAGWPHACSKWFGKQPSHHLASSLQPPFRSGPEPTMISFSSAFQISILYITNSKLLGWAC